MLGDFGILVIEMEREWMEADSREFPQEQVQINRKYKLTSYAWPKPKCTNISNNRVTATICEDDDDLWGKIFFKLIIERDNKQLHHS